MLVTVDCRVITLSCSDFREAVSKLCGIRASITGQHSCSFNRRILSKEDTSVLMWWKKCSAKVCVGIQKTFSRNSF